MGGTMEGKKVARTVGSCSIPVPFTSILAEFASPLRPYTHTKDITMAIEHPKAVQATIAGSPVLHLSGRRS